MSLLISQEILAQIKKELHNSKNNVMIISAFCKEELIRIFEAEISDMVKEKVLIVRMRPEDILCKATDLSIYEFCKVHGWKLYFRLDLHAKTYIFDNLRCIVGSANATSSGLSLERIGNYELASVNEIEEKDMLAIKKLRLSSVEMTDHIYDMMCDVINKNSKKENAVSTVSWTKEIIDLFVPDFSILFSEDFPNVFSPSVSIEWLSMDKNLQKEQIRELFEESKCYLWLVHYLANQENQEAYFGAVSAALHDVLLNDPKPYRRDVKELLGNLLNWIIELNCSEVQIDRPKYSQRIRLSQR